MFCSKLTRILGWICRMQSRRHWLKSVRMMLDTIFKALNITAAPPHWNLFFLDANTSNEVRSGGTLTRTTDGGQTWQAVVKFLESAAIHRADAAGIFRVSTRRHGGRTTRTAGREKSSGCIPSVGS